MRKRLAPKNKVIKTILESIPAVQTRNDCRFLMRIRDKACILAIELMLAIMEIDFKAWY